MKKYNKVLITVVIVSILITIFLKFFLFNQKTLVTNSSKKINAITPTPTIIRYHKDSVVSGQKRFENQDLSFNYPADFSYVPMGYFDYQSKSEEPFGVGFELSKKLLQDKYGYDVGSRLPGIGFNFITSYYNKMNTEELYQDFPLGEDDIKSKLQYQSINGHKVGYFTRTSYYKGNPSRIEEYYFILNDKTQDVYTLSVDNQDKIYKEVALSIMSSLEFK